MADLAIITPSRGRPERLAEMLVAVQRTAGSVSVYLGIDEDDQSDYSAIMPASRGLDVLPIRGKRRSLSAWTNEIAKMALCSADPPRYLASLGDDHVPLTPGWDRILIHAIRNNMAGPGFAYGNDLLQGGALPTSWVVSAEVVIELGWMMLPECEHMYVDAAIRELGMTADRLWYEPGVIIEHRHPIAGKTDWDASYRESNAVERYRADRRAYEAWRDDGGLARDAATLSALKY